MTNSSIDIYDNHELKTIGLLHRLIEVAGPALTEEDIQNKYAVVNCGEPDSAVASMLELSGAAHLYVIPTALIPTIESWINDLGDPGPDDDDYLWCAAEGAIAYSRSHGLANAGNHTIPIDLPEPDYNLVEKKAASFGTSPQELVTSWVKERLKEFAYA
jgi:hypothetical protein